MLLLLLASFVWLGCCGASTITLVDLQYTYPYCNSGPNTPLNALGELQLQLDLLGRWLRLTVQPRQTADSCRLCALNSTLCNTSFSQLGSALHLNTGAGYNVRLYWLTTPVQTTSYDVDPVTGVLTLAPGALLTAAPQYPDQVCGNQYRFVALALLTSEAPVRNFYVTLAVQDGAQETVPCDPNATSQGLSCRIAARFPVLELNATNCLAPQTQPPRAPVSTIHSLLYWQRNRDQWPQAPMPRLCGEDWASIWDRAAPQNYLCNADLALYIKPLPWYEAALEVSVALLNQEGALDAEVAWALDVLENYCGARQSGLLTLEDSLLYNVTVALRARHLLSLEQECDGLQIERSEALWPYYAQHYYEWQLQAFQYMFQLDASLPTKVVLLITGVVATFVLCTGFALYVAVRLWYANSSHSYRAV